MLQTGSQPFGLGSIRKWGFAMGDSTRPTHRHQQAVAFQFARLLVPFILVGSASAATQMPGLDDTPPTASFTVPAETTSIAAVAPGAEGLQLSARFTQDSMNYAQGIDWQIKSSLGEVLFKSTNDQADVKLKPGAYEVLASYGNVKIDEAITLPGQAHIAVNFVLNAGALRVLPRLKGIDGVNVPSQTRIFAMTGKDHGKLVATSFQPGETVKLAAGSYRVETTFDASNVTSATDIEVKAGIVRSIDIDHHAGLLHLSVSGETGAVVWTIRDDQGLTLTPAVGASAELALKPGHYVAEASIGGKTLRKELSILDGQMADIALGQ